METWIQVIAWIGLAGALALTVVALKLLALVLNALRHIRELANIIAASAGGLSRNLVATDRLRGIDEPAAALGRAGSRLGSAAGGLGERLEAFAAGLSRGRR